MKRTFLDWNKPCIPTLAEHLLKKCQVENTDFFDLSNYVLIFPNRAASKRFLTVLADHAWKTQCTIEPPRVKHMGDFMELLYEQKVPCASLLTQQVLWTAALKQTAKERSEFFDVLYPNAPDFSDMDSWFNIGAEMAEIFQDLARENLDFGQVFQICRDSFTFQEKSTQELKNHSSSNDTGILPRREILRWELLAHAERIYYQRMDEIGLWDRQAARLFALRNSENTPSSPSKDFQIPFRLGVVGCVDLSNLQREFLKRVESQVEVFIFAPETMKDRFEQDGCLKSGAWQRLEPNLNERLHQSLVQATTPEDQIQAVTDKLRSIAQNTRIEDVTLGVIDESLEPLLLQTLTLAGVPTLRSGKKILENLQPWKLLKSMSEYCQSILSFKPGQPLGELMESVGPSYPALAYFLRLEDVGNCLRAQKDEFGSPLISGDWLAELDQFFNRYYPSQMPHPDQLAKQHPEFPALTGAFRFVHGLLLDMAREYVNFHSLLSIVTQFLKRIYCWKNSYDSQNEEEYQIIRGGMELNHAFSDKLQLPPALLPELPLTFPQALNLLLTQTAGKQMASSSVPGTISIQRWLDLPLDDANVMFLIGMNEEFVPVETVSEHIFLPNQLRRKLNVKTNESRFERDLYNLSVIIAQRNDFFVTFGRISTDGKTLSPSRLLLTDATDRLIDQVIQFFDDPIVEKEDSSTLGNVPCSPQTPNQEREKTDFQPSDSSVSSASRLFSTPSISNNIPPITEMSVTDFSAFITNPYLFYLEKVLRLKTVNDFAQELPNSSFGTIIHEVLETFGRQEIAQRKEFGDINRLSLLENRNALKKETARIQTRLTEILNRRFITLFGFDPLPAINLQHSLIQARLEAFAQKQAEQYAEGWQIWDVERTIHSQLTTNRGSGKIEHFGTDHPSPMLIHGKFDRIDFRKCGDGTTAWRIWDYKTSSTSPIQRHFGKKNFPKERSPEIWRDLQLPLYLHLIHSAVTSEDPRYADLAQITASSRVEAGYILIPKKLQNTQFTSINWDKDLLDSANEKTFLIAHDVHDKRFPNLGELSQWHRETEAEWIIKPN